MSVHVQLLGQATAGGRHLPLDKRGCLLAHLAHAGGWTQRDQVAFLFWPDSDEPSSRRNLRQLLSRVKALPMAEALRVEPDRVCWPVDTDVAEFRQAVARREWARAVDVYGGDLLAGFYVEGAEGFNAWLEMEREDLRVAHRQAVLGLAEQLEADGAPEVAARHLRSLLDGDDLAEDVLRAYLRTAYLAGQRDLALAKYRQFRNRLALELGLEPLPETRQLAATISQSAPLALPQAPARSSGTVPLSVQRPPRLVGREAAAQAAISAVGPVVILQGEAGIGKTRLMEELAPRALRVRCQEALQSVPYQPLLETLREATARAQGLPDLGGYLEDLARLAPDLVPGVSPGPVEPSTSKARLLKALSLSFEELCREVDGFALVVDDLQWADASTLEFVALLGSRGRLRLLCAYRGHEVTSDLSRVLDSLRGARALTEVDLLPLDEEELRRLLAQLIGSEHGPPAFSRWLFDKSGGNPMFALETLRSMFENGTLHGDRQGWHTDIDAVTRDYSELEASSLISETIRRRLARLARGTLRTLQAAAVLGSSFDARLLSEVGNTTEWNLLDALEEAEAAGIIQGDRFRHDLLRQAIYDFLPPPRRALLHARAAECLEGMASPIVIAEHWLAGDRPALACERWLEAARQMRHRGLFHEATPLLERALRHAPDERSASKARVALAGLYRALGRHDEATPMAEYVLAGCDDPALRVAALETRAGSLLSQGRLDDAESAAREGMALAAASGQAGQERGLAGLLAHVEIYRGRPENAFALVDPIVRELRREGNEVELCAQLSSLAVIYDHRGDHQAALPLHLEALAIARRLAARFQQVDISLNLLMCYMDLGRTEEGLDAAEEALGFGTFEGSAALRNNLAAALAELGRHEDARRHYELLLEESQDPTLVTIGCARLARIYRRLGLTQNLTATLERVLVAVQDTDYHIARAAAAISLMTLGSPDQREQALKISGDVDRLALPPYLLAEFEAAFGEETRRASERD